MEAATQGKHFVLVHGLCHGAWCWYKLSPLLKKAGHRVTALDMAASGVNMKAIEELRSLEEYTEPLLNFIASLPSEEQVILVGHSMGGMNVALAMEKFPHKISAAVCLTAFVPDTINQPSFVLDKFLSQYLKDAGWTLSSLHMVAKKIPQQQFSWDPSSPRCFIHIAPWRILSF